MTCPCSKSNLMIQKHITHLLRDLTSGLELSSSLDPNDKLRFITIFYHQFCIYRHLIDRCSPRFKNYKKPKFLQHSLDLPDIGSVINIQWKQRFFKYPFHLPGINHSHKLQSVCQAISWFIVWVTAWKFQWPNWEISLHFERTNSWIEVPPKSNPNAAENVFFAIHHPTKL